MITLSTSEVATYYGARVPDLPQRGKRWRGGCPIHDGTHANFSVDPETGLWRCWSCGRYGNVEGLEMALTNVTWREAVTEVERIIGRVLLDRPASRAARRALADRREGEQRELQAAEFFRIAATSMAEQVLDELPGAVPERYGSTQLLRSLRAARGAELRALYRDHFAREPRLTEALVFAGQQAWRRLCMRLAHFIASSPEAPHVA
jgi:hypothetical protein